MKAKLTAVAVTTAVSVMVFAGTSWAQVINPLVGRGGHH